MNENYGNKAPANSLVEVLLKLKEVTFRDINCVNIGIIQSEKTLTLLNNPDMTLNYLKLQNLELQKDDLVVIAFCDEDINTNYNKFIRGVDLKEKTTDSINKHSKNNAIVIGILYRNEEE